jgi:hypothetical protein
MLETDRVKKLCKKKTKHWKMDSENIVSFGSIFDNKVALNDDSESNLLNYSKPEYAASFSNYTDCR